MANTYTSLNYHIIFSTKDREPWITQDIEQRIWTYLAGIALQNEMTPMRFGGVEDHVHLLVRIPAKMAVSVAVQRLKGASSKWIHEVMPTMKGFAWQDGYGAFTVSKSQIEGVDTYIRKQRERHRTRSFKEEFLGFLKRYGVDYDARYVWG